MRPAETASRHRSVAHPIGHGVPLALALFIASAAFGPRAAHAQDRSTYVETRTDSGAAIVFKEDLATGSTLGANGATIRAPSAAFRMGLVRPRLNFVSEMYKSVEAL